MAGIDCHGGTPVNWGPASGPTAVTSATPAADDGGGDVTLPPEKMDGGDRFSGEVYAKGPEFDKMLNIWDKMARHQA